MGYVNERRRRATSWPMMTGMVMALAVAIAVGFSPAQPAHASTDIEFSTDGVTYLSSLPGSLFDESMFIIPGDSQSTTFFVRNASSQAGYLRIALTGVTVSDPALAGALSVSASTVDYPGSPAALSEAQPCRVLTEGDLLAAGGKIEVTTSLILGNLDGLDGQGGRAGLSLRVSLSDAAVGSLSPTACGGAGVDIPVAGPGTPAVVAMTGFELPMPLIVGTAGLLGAGIFLLVTARRRWRAER